VVADHSDHNTGGMDIGNRDYNGAYTHLTVEELIDPLKGMQVTAGALAGEIVDAGGADVFTIQDKTAELWGLDVSEEVAQEILAMAGTQEGQDGYTISLDYALARVLSAHYTAIGWTSHGHNAEDVPVWAYGPGAPSGLLDNTELANLVADLFGLNMEALNRWLFVDLDEAFPGRWALDTTDPANPVARVGGGATSAELPCSKDLLTITRFGHSKTFNLKGLVVYAPDTGRVYVPQQAVRLMRRFGIW
jgi:alkaline phosphatase